MTARKLHLVLVDKIQVHNHYLPMIEGGGLFVPTNDDFNFNDLVEVQVELVAEKNKATVPGKVVWLTPSGAQRGIVRGVGIQFQGEHQPKVQQYFEGIISDRIAQAPPAPCY